MFNTLFFLKHYKEVRAVTLTAAAYSFINSNNTTKADNFSLGNYIKSEIWLAKKQVGDIIHPPGTYLNQIKMFLFSTIEEIKDDFMKKFFLKYGRITDAFNPQPVLNVIQDVVSPNYKSIRQGRAFLNTIVGRITSSFKRTLAIVLKPFTFVYNHSGIIQKPLSYMLAHVIDNLHVYVPVVITTVLILYLIRFLVLNYHYPRYYMGCLIDLCSITNINVSRQREYFRDMRIDDPYFHQSDNNHPHPHAAKTRLSASKFINKFISHFNMQPYSVSMSLNDRREGIEADRVYYNVKDLTMQPAPPTNFTSSTCLKMIDVDYYLDLSNWLVNKHLTPLLMYTFVPTQAAVANFNNSSFTFNKEGKVVYSVDGGAAYVHDLWNYEPDLVYLRKTFLGLPIFSTLYHVERKTVDEHHQIIFLCPIRRMNIIGTVLTWLFLKDEAAQLRKFNPVMKVKHPKEETFVDIINFEVKPDNQPIEICLARVGEHSAAKILKNEFESLRTTVELSPLNMNVASVTTALLKAGMEQDEAREMAPNVTFALLARDNKRERVNQHALTEPPVIHYSTKPDNMPKPSMYPIFPGFVLGATFAPLLNLGNEIQSIKSRIHDLQNIPPIELKDYHDRTRREFIDFLLDYTHTRGVLTPVDTQAVYDQQSRPTQRSLLQRAFSFPGTFPGRIVSFIKREAYDEAKDSRTISTIPPDVKLDYSRVMMAVSTWMADIPSYGFGKSGLRVSRQVAEVATRALARKEPLIETDYSRFDGRSNLITRAFEEELLAKLFPEEQRQQVLDLHAKQYNQKGVGMFGTKYETGYSRASGSPETSAMNTLVNMYIGYSVLSRNYYLPEVAFKMVMEESIFGGDDGIMPYVDENKLRSTVANYGHKITVTVRQMNTPITFLGRYYTDDVWTGAMGSLADPARFLLKFHLTSLKDFDPFEKLLDKANSFRATDLNAPLLSDYCRVIQKLGVKLKTKIHDEVRHAQRRNGDHYNIDEQYISAPTDWALNLYEQLFPGILENSAKFTKWLKTLEYHIIDGTLSNENLVREILNPPPIYEAHNIEKSENYFGYVNSGPELEMLSVSQDPDGLKELVKPPKFSLEVKENGEEGTKLATEAKPAVGPKDTVIHPVPQVAPIPSKITAARNKTKSVRRANSKPQFDKNKLQTIVKLQPKS